MTAPYTSAALQNFVAWLKETPSPTQEALRAKLKESELTRVLLDKKFDAPAVSLFEFADIARAVAQVNPSAAWLVVQYASMASASSRIPSAEEVFMRKDILVAGGFGNGKATVDGAELVLNGNIGFGSGSKLADYVQVPAHVGGPQDARLCLAKADQLVFHDDWDVVGMRATDSVTYELNGTRTSMFMPLVEVRRSPQHLGKLSWIAFFAVGFGAISIGALDFAANLFEELAVGKTAALSTSSLSKRHDAQTAMGYAMACSVGGWASVRRCAELLTEIAEGRGEVTSASGAEARAAGTFAIRTAYDGAQQLFLAAGTSALYESNRLTGVLADISTVSQHIHGRTTNYTEVGKLRFKEQAQIFL